MLGGRSWHEVCTPLFKAQISTKVAAAAEDILCFDCLRWGGCLLRPETQWQRVQTAVGFDIAHHSVVVDLTAYMSGHVCA